MAIGRISGPLLKANLIRDGVDLAFETDLLYLDVNNGRIGVNNVSPQYDLDVNGTVRSTNIQIDNQAVLAGIIISGNNLVSSTNVIDFTASAGDPTVYHSKLIIDDFQVQGNVISTTVSNSPIELRTNGVGSIELQANTNITGDLFVSGNITADGDIVIGGNIVIGNETSDTVSLNSRIDSNILPKTNVTYDLGSESQRWRKLYSADLLLSNELKVGDLTISGNTISTTSNSIEFDTPPGQYVAFNSILLVDDIKIQGNKISTVVSNSPLEIEASGTGTINVLSDSEIQGDVDVSGDFTVDGNLLINGNTTIGSDFSDAIVINAGISSDLIPRVNNTYSLGDPSFRWKDVYVNNFYTNSIIIDELDIGNLTFRNNEITSAPGENILINGTGTGGVQLGNFRITNNIITNVVSGAISTIQQTGIGYFKIATNNGFVVPLGTTSERPSAYAVLGMTRYNTDTRALEVWNGSAWASPAGALGAVSEALANDIAAATAIALG
jgi:cytoskeletal protein CcmA (bactofilin family)